MSSAGMQGCRLSLRYSCATSQFVASLLAQTASGPLSACPVIQAVMCTHGIHDSAHCPDSIKAKQADTAIHSKVLRMTMQCCGGQCTCNQCSGDSLAVHLHE